MSAESQNFGNQPQRLDAIRDRLAKATPGPWYQGRNSAHYENEVVAASRDIGRCWASEDADLIANAPADLAFLLAELDAAQARNAYREAP